MKQLTIKVTVPKENDSWRVSIGKGRPRKKKNAVGVFRCIERFLSRNLLTFSASEVEDKIKVLVDYSAIHNEKPMRTNSWGVYTQVNEALYCLALYLEDFLPQRYLNRKYKLYGEKFVGNG